jgi:ureidoglycolate lyase
MTEVIDIPIESLTDDAFAPFGSVIAELPAGVPAVYGIKPARVLDFGIEGSARLVVVRYPHQPMEFARLERHVLVTETRVPLLPVLTVMVVAPAAAKEDQAGYPEPASVRAFLLDGRQGILLYRGVWHGLDCYPVGRPHVDFLVISEGRTEDEWILGKDPDAHEHSRTVDYRDRRMSFRIVDPKGLLRDLGPAPAAAPLR